jgi:hypothetical protein
MVPLVLEQVQEKAAEEREVEKVLALVEEDWAEVAVLEVDFQDLLAVKVL